MTEAGNQRLGYPAEKFAAARRTLMAPHPGGDDRSFAGAFLECDIGLRNVRDDDLDAGSRSWVASIRRLSDTSGVEPDNRGTALRRAEELSLDEKEEFSTAVNELADWFHQKF
jgi:hypothetical protein